MMAEFCHNSEDTIKDHLFSGRNRYLYTTFVQLMIVNILISLIQPCNQAIDSMLTGKKLGLYAMNAYALFLPVGALISALSSFFAIGTQICCTKLIGRGQVEETKKVTATGYFAAAVFSVVLAMVMLLMPEKIAVILGANSNIVGQIESTASFLEGYAVGMPAIFLMQIMLPLVQIEGKKFLATLSTVAVLIINVTGDLLNIYVFKGGLFGMALATSFSNIAGFLVAFIYLLFFARMFRFSIGKCSMDFLKKIMGNGLPSLSYYGSIVIRTIFFNYLILTRLNHNIMAVMVVVNSFTCIVDAAMGGTGDAVLLLGGVLNGEMDKNGQRNLLKLAFLFGGSLLLALMVITLAAANPFASLFSRNDEREFICLVARALRITSLYFVPDVFSCILKKFIQTVGKARYVSVTNVLCNVVYVCGGAFILVGIMGSDGLFLSYTFCYVAILLTHLIYAQRISRKSFFRFDNLLFLSDEETIPDENMMEWQIDDLSDCAKVSQSVSEFCDARGISSKKAYYLSLVTEEATDNIVQHGFSGKKKEWIIVKVILLKDKISLNIKDNCRYFDPVRYYEKLIKTDDPEHENGLKIMAGLSDNMTYSNSFNLNNLRIEMFLE